MNNFLSLITVILLLSAAVKQSWLPAALGSAIYLAGRWRAHSSNDKLRRQTIYNGCAILETFLLVWQVATVNVPLLDKVLFPAPETVFKLFITELPDMFQGLLSSLYLLGSGYLLALATAIPLGLLVGQSRITRESCNPYSKVLGSIPPIVYIPYAIALLPSFSAASIFVIFVGAFWPLFISTVSGVVNISPNLIDSAKMLHLKKATFFFRILLPGALPSICTGASLALVLSFLLLTAAELIGATSGLGWYVKNFSDFADFPRVIAGIIFIGIVITVITSVTDRIERRLLRHLEADHD